MQKANASLLVIVVAVVAAIFAAEWYFFDHLPRQAEYEAEGVGPMPEQSNLAGDTSEIVECEDGKGGTFYTNRESCEKAKEELAENPSLLREE